METNTKSALNLCDWFQVQCELCLCIIVHSNDPLQLSMSRLLVEIGRFLPGFLLFPLAFIHIRRYFRRNISQFQPGDSATRSIDKSVDNNKCLRTDDKIEWDANTIATRYVFYSA